ncbi:MAG: aldo/keto reductase, partial [Comamonadaceae bacterium]
MPAFSLPSDGLTRAALLRRGLGLSLAAALPGAATGQSAPPVPGATGTVRPAAASPTRMATRPIPSTGEALPVIGCGTYVGFNHAPDSADYKRLPAVLQALFAAGGKVLDSSPMYGRSETTTGELLAQGGLHRQAFIATKVWTSGRDAGIRQMEESMRLLQTQRVDLMQVHNLVDWRTQLATLRQWKQDGRVRYIGITHYTSAAYREVEAVLKGEKLDFLQINYAMDDRDAEARVLPLAAERGVAVLVNTPFGGGGLLRNLRGKPLPAWAADIGATNWAQVLLKFVLSHPAVTCAQ